MRSSSLLIGLGAGAAIILLRDRGRLRRRERLAAASLEALLNAVDAHDHTTGTHVRRVAAYALILARAVGLDQRECRKVERLALFHDIGKIDEAVADLVDDPSILNPEEYERIRLHPQKGAAVLRPLAIFYPDLGEGVLSHHERWDGSGYPRRLRGTEIPLPARIVAIADAFDVITHDRPYKRGLSAAEAAKRIAAGRGTQFDPALVDVFLAPATLKEVKRAVAAARRRTTRPDERRRRRHQHAPDVTFRWRSAEREPPAPGPELQTPPG